MSSFLFVVWMCTCGFLLATDWPVAIMWGISYLFGMGAGTLYRLAINAGEVVEEKQKRI